MSRRVLTDEQWFRIEGNLPGRSGMPVRSGVDNRLFADAILWMAGNAAHWRDLPDVFGKWTAGSCALSSVVAQWGMGQIAWITVERMEGEVPTVELTHVPMGLGRNDAATMRFNADTGQRLPDEPASSGAPGVTQRVLFNLHEGLYADILGRWTYLRLACCWR